MTAVPAPVSSTAAGALSAFLRGVERRALVVAELQCGGAARAEQAPWAVRGATPPLPRLALLLRVGGSLDEGIAMRVLDQDEAGYQHLLADACPRDAHGQPEASAAGQLAEQVQERLRELPAARLHQLPPPAPPPPRPPPPQRPPARGRPPPAGGGGAARQWQAPSHERQATLARSAD